MLLCGGLAVHAGIAAAQNYPAKPVRIIVRSLALPDTKARIAGVGAREVGSAPEEFALHIKRELAIWEKVVKAAGIRID